MTKKELENYVLSTDDADLNPAQRKLKAALIAQAQAKARANNAIAQISRQARRADTRRKILLGVVFEHMLNIEWKTAKIRPWLHKHINDVITRDVDREFLASQGFDFLVPAPPPKSNPESKPGASESEITIEDLESLAQICEMG